MKEQSELYTIKMVKNGKDVGALEITSFSNGTDPVVLSYNDHNGFCGTVYGPDYFEALSQIREKLSNENISLLCKGSKLNVFPGGLESEQSMGEISYEEVQGNYIPVNIFEESNISEIDPNCSYEMQKDARRKAIRGREV